MTRWGAAVMIEFRTIETFMWVATLRSFRRAADKLNTTQPSVSMRIAQLEDYLGVRLLERDRRFVALTHKGQEFLGHAERLIRQRAEMIEAVGDRSTMRGIVRLGVSETIVHTSLPSLIERVNAAYPNLELEIEVDISTNLWSRLVARDLSLALLLGPISNPGVHTRPLCSFPLAFIASEAMRMPSTTMPLAAIAQWPIITFPRNTQPYMTVRELFAQSGLRATIHASASLATIVRMTLDGIGIAVIPPVILRSVEGGRKLRTLKTTARLPPLNFVVSWPATPDSFTAQKVAEIALLVARQKP